MIIFQSRNDFTTLQKPFNPQNFMPCGFFSKCSTQEKFKSYLVLYEMCNTLRPPVCWTFIFRSLHFACLSSNLRLQRKPKSQAVLNVGKINTGIISSRKQTRRLHPNYHNAMLTVDVYCRFNKLQCLRWSPSFLSIAERKQLPDCTRDILRL